MNLTKTILNGIPEGVKIVSFDLFDTLILRKTDPPDEVIRIVSNTIAQRNLISLSGQQLLLLRDKIENQIRSSKTKSGLDPEVSLREMYSELLRKTNTDCPLSTLLNTELEIELNLLMPMPGVRELLTKLSSQYPLIIISDTYYPLWMIEYFLKKLKIFDFFKSIYCSCEHDLNKGSGRLFQKVMYNEQLQPHQLIHFGDNIQCDYLVPKSIGISAKHILCPWNLKRRNQDRVFNLFENKNKFWLSNSFFNKIFSGHVELSLPKKDLFLFGKEVVGPLLTIFTHLLINEIQKDGIKNVLFLARDGYMLKKIYNFLSKELYNSSLPKAQYICISRQSSFSPSIKAIDDRIFHQILSGAHISIQDIFQRLQLKIDNKILERHSICRFDMVNRPQNKGKMKNLFKDPDFNKTIIENSTLLRRKLKSYLTQYSFFKKDNPTALVDVGWLGTIQDNIEHAFSTDPDFPELQGYYLASSQPLLYKKSDKNKLGIMYNYRDAIPEEASMSLFREALEFSTRANHGTTIGYRHHNDDKVVAVFKENSPDRIKEKKINSDIREIQRGVLSFLKSYVSLQKNYQINPTVLKPFVIKRYDAAISFPDKKHINAMLNIGNADDFGLDGVRNIVQSYKISDFLNPIKFTSKFIDTPWREASLIKTKIPFLNVIYLFIKRTILWKRIGNLLK